MTTFSSSPLPYVKYDEDLNKTDVKLKLEHIEIKYENCDTNYPEEKLEIKEEHIEVKDEKRDTHTIDVDVLSQNANTAEFDINIAKDLKQSDVCKWQKGHNCSLCDFVTNSWYSLKVHVVNVHNTGVLYECSNCDYRTPVKSCLKQHLSSKERCQVRLARMKKLDGINTPQEFCSKEESGFKCIYCEYISGNKQTVKRHVYKVHLKLKSYSCLHCEFKTPYLKTLEAHMVRRHPEKCDQSQLENKFCDLCDKMYSTIYGLQRHMEIKHSGENIRCTLCDYTCVQNQELVFHMKRFHEQKKLFECHDCGYTSTRKLILKEHILRKHLKWEEYNCDLCSFKTLYRETLKVHKERHNCSGSFVCEYCSFITLNNKALEKHTRVQHKDSLLECDQCDYRTTFQGNLRRHVRYMHNKIEHVCHVCGKYRYTDKSNLLCHMYKIHGKQPARSRRTLCQENVNLDIDGVKAEETIITEQRFENDCKEQVNQRIKFETIYVPSLLDYQEDALAE